MNRASSWLAWSLCGLSLVLTALSLFLFALNLSYSGAHVYDYWLQNAVQAVSFSIIGAIIASRLPANPVGWLFCAAGCTIAVDCLSAEYASYALVVARPDSLPIGEAFAWLAFWAWVPSIGFIVLSLLFFPNGRLPSGRWKWLAWLTVLLTIAGAVWVALSPGEIGNLGSIPNPLGIEGLPDGYYAVSTMSALVLVAAVSTLGLRLLRARGIERQQIKWPAFVAVVAAVGSIFYDTAISEAIGLRWLEWAGHAVVVVALVGFPISIGIAIVRYRLYEIDALINRSLVYALLTAISAAVYFGAVVLLQRVFVLLTGDRSTLAIVASTLLIAALFNPLRRLIQSFIDRRFYRRKYDARKTLEAFSAKLRDETDLDALSGDLVGVVSETMQPAHVSLWLRSEPFIKDY
jgi:hypothetical protein